MTDLDRRGDLFGNKEEEEEEPNYKMVTAGKEQGREER